MKGRLLLNVVIGEGTTVLKLLAGEDQTLLVGRNTLLILDLGFDVVDGVGRFDLEGNRLARQGLDENLHSTAETEDQVKGRLLLDVAAEACQMRVRVGGKGRLGLLVAQGATILELLASEDKTLLVRWDALLVLNFRLDIIDSVRGLDFESDSLSGEGLNEDLHVGM